MDLESCGYPFSSSRTGFAAWGSEFIEEEREKRDGPLWSGAGLMVDVIGTSGISLSMISKGWFSRDEKRDVSDCRKRCKLNVCSDSSFRGQSPNTSRTALIRPFPGFKISAQRYSHHLEYQLRWLSSKYLIFPFELGIQRETILRNGQVRLPECSILLPTDAKSRTFKLHQNTIPLLVGRL